MPPLRADSAVRGEVLVSVVRMVTSPAGPILAIALGLPIRAHSQDPIPQAVREAAMTITSTQLVRDVGYLASDALRGRGTPSPGLDSAIAYVVRRISELGLRPVGDQGTCLQDYPLREVAVDPVGSFLEVAGQRYPAGENVLITWASDSVTVRAPLAYVGHGIQVPGKGIDPYARVDIRGKIVVAHGPGILPRGESFESLGVIGVDWLPPPLVAEQRGAAAGLGQVSSGSGAAGWRADPCGRASVPSHSRRFRSGL